MNKSIITILLFIICVAGISQSDYITNYDFNSANDDWTAYNREDVVTKTANGKYTIQYKKENSSWSHNREIYVNPNEDYEITVAVAQTEGKSTKAHGFVFAREDKDNSYAFCIASNGNVTILKTANGKEANILEWKLCSAVKPIPQTNILSLKKTANRWNFYVNNVEVHSMETQKAFGFYYGFYTTSEITIEYDYFQIKQKAKVINLIENSNQFGERENLGSNVNSNYTEKSPVITADEQTIYYTRDEHPGNIGEKKNDDIWVSSLNENTNTWSLAKNVGSPWNTNGNNFIVSISGDNTVALLGNKYDSTGNTVGKGISISYKKASGWTRPKEMKIKNYYNYNIYSESCLSSEGDVLLISCERDQTYGEKDIYFCTLLPDSTWSEPKNIGNVANSFADEVGPFLAADGITMYFSSAGHPGYGKNDIFMTRRLDDTWTKWSEPKNLGPKVNTAKWDAYYTVPASGKNAYLVSSTPGAKTDIYRIKQPESAKPLPLAFVKGIVYNSETKKNMSAEITYSELGSDKILGHAKSDPTTGMFNLSLTKGKKYSFNASHPGFASVHYNYDATDIGAYQEEKIDLYLTPIKKGVSIVMNNLFFTANKFDLLPTSYPELDKLYKLLLDNPTVTIEIGGHTSINTSGDKFNKELSTNRAAEVKNYIINKGIDKKRITSKGYGYSKPIYKTEVESEQAKNRRVEFTIISE
jgi:outer membrane protein OmpA-like peptidoglycan-associated protein